jgi:very-short-patch-repair endonuclease
MDKKFRRQHVFANYVLDFYCHEKKLGIELDGSVHNKAVNKEYDRIRSQNVKVLGVTIIRFQNWEVVKNINEVLRIISQYLA